MLGLWWKLSGGSRSECWGMERWSKGGSRRYGLGQDGVRGVGSRGWDWGEGCTRCKIQYPSLCPWGPGLKQIFFRHTIHFVIYGGYD